MLGAHQAKERSVAEFVAIFRQASAGFAYVGATGGEPGVFQSLLEFAYRGDGGGGAGPAGVQSEGGGAVGAGGAAGCGPGAAPALDAEGGVV
jgi:hypothetical protein